MDGHPQTIFIPGYMKKLLLSILIIFVLSFIVFLGINYTKNNLASFSSIITAWVAINPMEVDVSAPAKVEVNKVFKVTAKVINKGTEKVENAKGEIHLPSGLVLLKKESVQKIGVIRGKKEKKVSWMVKGEEIGTHIITVSASGELREELISAEDTTTVEVKESTSPGGRNRFDFFQRFFDFFREWLGY